MIVSFLCQLEVDYNEARLFSFTSVEFGVRKDARGCASSNSDHYIDIMHTTYAQF